MKKLSIVVVAATFLTGIVVGALAASAKADASLFAGKSPKQAAAALLDVAAAQAGKGSWENIGVARAYYLGGEKARGAEILEQVMAGKVKESDWMRVGRVYEEAGEWGKAKEAFEKALAADPKDAGNHAEIGAWYNLHGDRARAEELFARALQLKNDEVWVTVNIAGSYVGVKPQ